MAISESQGYLAYMSTVRANTREKIWCNGHADCVSLNWRWCCVPYGNRKLAVNGVSLLVFNKTLIAEG